MTLPYERYRSVRIAEKFLLELCDPKATPRVSKAIRERARSCLRHFPTSLDMEMVAKACPDRFEVVLDSSYPDGDGYWK